MASFLALAEEVTSDLQKGMLCPANRGFFSFDLWNRARAGGADLLWRLKKDRRLEMALLGLVMTLFHAR